MIFTLADEKLEEGGLEKRSHIDTTNNRRQWTPSSHNTTSLEQSFRWILKCC